MGKRPKGHFMTIFNSEIVKELNEIQMCWVSGIIIYSVNLRVVIATYSWCAAVSSSSQAALNPKLPTTCTTTNTYYAHTLLPHLLPLF